MKIRTCLLYTSRDLLGYNIGDPEELQIILEENIMMEKCPVITATAVELLDGILSEEE